MGLFNFKLPTVIVDTLKKASKDSKEFEKNQAEKNVLKKPKIIGKNMTKKERKKVMV